MPRGHEHDPIYSLSIYLRFSGQFFWSDRPRVFFYSTGASVVLCLAVWPREEWEERPQPAPLSGATQARLKHL